MTAILAVCFFFQAEDGIRDYKVTGVQTCALPISSKAGLKENDVVTEINGQRVEGSAQFRRMIREIPGGRNVQLSVWRDGKQQNRSEEHTSELQSPCNLVCRLLLEKKKIKQKCEMLFSNRRRTPSSYHAPT